MRRSVMSVLTAGLFAASLFMSGCGGGGIDEGMPADVKPQPIPSNVQTKMGPPSKGNAHGKVGAGATAGRQATPDSSRGASTGLLESRDRPDREPGRFRAGLDLYLRLCDKTGVSPPTVVP